MTRATGAAPPAQAARTFCTFRLGDSLFGLDILLVKEINTLPPLTSLPHAPEAVRGYVNLRGQIHLVLDLKRLLRLGTTEATAEARLVLFKPALGDPFGVMVDRIGDIVSLAEAQIEDLRGEEGVEAAAIPPQAEALVSGVGKLAEELVILLDARRLLPQVERALQSQSRGEDEAPAEPRVPARREPRPPDTPFPQGPRALPLTETPP
jgi:purine-binding chemotaxis protein CheW